MVCCPVLSSVCRPGNYCNCDQWQLWLRSLAALLQTLVQLRQSARKSGMGFVLHPLSSPLCLTDKLSTKHASVLPVSFLHLCLSPTKYFSFSLTAISTQSLIHPPPPTLLVIRQNPWCRKYRAAFMLRNGHSGASASVYLKGTHPN